MRKWWLPGIGAVLAAMVAVSVWLFTRGDEKSGYYTAWRPARDFATAREAVLAVCHADGARTPWEPDPDPASVTNIYLQGDGFPMVWIGPGEDSPWVAVLHEFDGRFTVEKCRAFRP